MANIQFQEPQYNAPLATPKRSWLTNLVLKAGLAKDDAGAQKVLLIVLVIIIIATILVWII